MCRGGGGRQGREEGREAERREKRKRQRKSLEWDPVEVPMQTLKLILHDGYGNGAAETTTVSAQREDSAQSKGALLLTKVITAAVTDLRVFTISCVLL